MKTRLVFLFLAALFARDVGAHPFPQGQVVLTVEDEGVDLYLVVDSIKLARVYALDSKTDRLTAGPMVLDVHDELVVYTERSLTLRNNDQLCSLIVHEWALTNTNQEVVVKGHFDCEAALERLFVENRFLMDIDPNQRYLLTLLDGERRIEVMLNRFQPSFAYLVRQRPTPDNDQSQHLRSWGWLGLIGGLFAAGVVVLLAVRASRRRLPRKGAPNEEQ